MKLKLHTCLILAIASVSPCTAQIRTSPHEWNATLKVVDEAGQPIAGAEVWVAFSVATPGGTPIDTRITGLTDTNGIFSARHTDRSIQLSFFAQKEDYYPYWVQHYLGFSVERQDKRWTPTPVLVLKRILNPIPMYAKFVNSFTPTNAKPVGFDFMVGDWTEPYGKGKNTDILFTTHFDRRSRNDYDYNFTVSFPNRGDGIQGFAFPYIVGQGSTLRSPQKAPENGYEPQIIKSCSQRPDQSANIIWDATTNYIFRVRTVLDEKGVVKSSLYGKIYGDFNQFRYFLNPTPNDRNVEFDPKQNLFKGLKGSQMVDVP